jgi:putative chitinase
MSQSSFGEVLSRLWPSGDAKVPGLRAGMIASAPQVFTKYGITTPVLAAHVMAQISHECGAGHEVVENLNYSAGRMMQVWPSRFPTMASAQPYAGNPRALANKVYNGRMGNAAGSDDGWNFRGRGAAQTTGREGYARLAKATGLDLVHHPDLVNDPQRFLECGVADFILCGCLPFAKADDVLNVTRRLNGGTVGLAQRRAWLAKWKAALGSAPIVLAPAPGARTPAPASRKAAPVLPPPPFATQSMLARFIAAVIAAFRRK